MDFKLYIRTTISFRKLFQCSSIIQIFYTNRYTGISLLLADKCT